WLGAAEFFDTPYFHFLSDDDLLAPFHLEYVLSRMKTLPNVGAFGTGNQYGTGLWERELQRSDLRLGDDYLNRDDQCCYWSRVAWLAVHSICSAVCINATLFRTNVLYEMNPLFDSEAPLVGDRWFMARVGAKTECVTS